MSGIKTRLEGNSQDHSNGYFKTFFKKIIFFFNLNSSCKLGLLLTCFSIEILSCPVTISLEVMRRFHWVLLPLMPLSHNRRMLFESQKIDSATRLSGNLSSGLGLFDTMILRGDQLERFLRQSTMEASGVQSAIMRVNGILDDIFQPQHLSLFDFKRAKISRVQRRQSIV